MLVIDISRSRVSGFVKSDGLELVAKLHPEVYRGVGFTGVFQQQPGKRVQKSTADNSVLCRLDNASLALFANKFGGMTLW